MEKFVRVRVVQGNALDLSLFQIDYDLTFAALFLNADRTLYGRFGSRSDHEKAEKDITVDGLRKAMQAALDLHQGYPGNKESLRGKQPVPVSYKTPEDYPALAGKYQPSLDYGNTNKLARSCLHCHQVREAERIVFRTARQAIPDEVLFPWPMPDTVGLSLDPKEKATVSAVKTGSAAAQAGFQPGDEIVSLAGQPLLSMADAQWVLHHAPSPAELPAQVRRAGKPLPLTLRLAADWRRQSDIAWRTTTWDLRRMAFGGLVLKELDDEARRTAGLGETALGLRVHHVGQYGEHAAAKRAGFQKDDILVELDGQSARRSETDLLRQLLQTKFPGDRVPATVLRKGTRVPLPLPSQ